jgi:hypothetical protein
LTPKVLGVTSWFLSLYYSFVDCMLDILFFCFLVVVLHVGDDHVYVRPVVLLEQSIAQLLEATLVHLMDLIHVLLADVAVQVDDKGLYDFGHVGGGVEAGLQGPQVAEVVAELGAVVVGVVISTTIVTATIVSHGGGTGGGNRTRGHK